MARITNFEHTNLAQEFSDADKEYIDDKDIDFYAQEILDTVRSQKGAPTSEKVTYIIQGLDSPSVFRYMHRMGILEWKNRQLCVETLDGTYEAVPIPDVERAIEVIRKAVYEKIVSQLYAHEEWGIDPRAIAITHQSRHLSGNIHELLSADTTAKIHKKLLNDRDHALSRRAIEQLVTLPDHPAIRKPSHYDEATGETLMPEYDMSTLAAEWLYSVEGGEPPVLELTHHELIQAIIDVVEATQFLLQHRLLLGDLSSSNIGIDRKTRRGFVYDFDQLTKTSQHPEEIYRPDGHTDPPGYIPSYERDLMSDIGIILGEMTRAIPFSQPAASELQRLQKDMFDKKVGCNQTLLRLRSVQEYLEA